MRFVSGLLVLALLVGLVGCDRGRPRAPVRGKVLIDGKPLEFGSVMFQSEGGQPSRGDIQSDGSFELETPGEGAGAVVGHNMVRVSCTTNQMPSALIDTSKELPAGESLIPERYAHFPTSGLSVDVPPEGRDDVLLELTRKPE